MLFLRLFLLLLVVGQARRISRRVGVVQWGHPVGWSSRGRSGQSGSCTTHAATHSSSTRSPLCKQTQPGRQRVSGRKVEIGGRVVNAQIVRCVADQHRGDAGRARGLHVERRVAQIPDRSARPSPRARQGPDGSAPGPACRPPRRRRRQPCRNARPSRDGRPRRGGICRSCWRRRPAARTRPARQGLGGTRHGPHMREVLGGEGGVEDVARRFPAVAEHRGKLSRNDTRTRARVSSAVQCGMAKAVNTALSAAAMPAQPSTRVLSQS